MFTIVHAIVGYFYLLIIIRLLPRRPGAQMTQFEFVLIFLIGGVIILTTMDDDHSVINGICGVVTIGLLHRCVNFLKQRYPRFGAFVDGPPVLLLSNGKWHVESMRKMHVDDSDVMAAARTKGVRTLMGIKYAVLERNGAITVIPKD